ncbi:hypothetical protein P9209_12670 [Prescottella defluvii]|nr:hypothetical protein P9209_12670 [Prescottella defluvii]
MTTTPGPVQPPVVVTESGGREQRWPIPVDEDSLLKLIHILFVEHWDDIWFGIIMEGAAWEVAAPNAPTRISMFDGYATIDFGRWHFHLCIGEHNDSGPSSEGFGGAPAPSCIAASVPTARPTRGVSACSTAATSR